MNMETLNIGKSDLRSSRLVYGCMRMAGDHTLPNYNAQESFTVGKNAIRVAIDQGYNHFDHADVYGGGQCETLFAEALEEIGSAREHLIITSKCGCRGKGNPNKNDPARYDFSKDYMLSSVEGSLSRLKVDYLDVLLLHRPDYLFDAEEVATIFQQLLDSGKVLYFGVSNFRPSQVSLLQSFCSMPLVANQIEINIHNMNALLDGTLDQCQQLNITPQAWCPMGGVVYPAWGNTFTEKDEHRIKAEFDYQAKKYNTENWIIMLAWLLKHPAKVTPIIGSTNPSRIKLAKHAFELPYTREDWYRLLEARNGQSVS